MADLNPTIDRATQISRGVANTLERRMRSAIERYTGRLRKAGTRLPRRFVDAENAARPVAGRVGITAIDASSARCCSGTRCAQRGNNWLAHEAAGKPPVLHYEYEMIADARIVRAARQLRAGADRSAQRRSRSTTRCARSSSSIRAPDMARASAASRRTPRSASRCRPGIPVYFVIFFPGSRAGPDARRRHRRRSRVRPHRRGAASGEPEARDRRQLPGRLGGDDARRRAARHRRPAASSTARRCRTGRATTARIRCATRAACSAARGSSLFAGDLGARQVRRRASRRQFREPQSGQYALGQVVPPVREHRHERRASSSSSAGGAASTCSTTRRSAGSSTTSSSATSSRPARRGWGRAATST